jgi:hypothetical protein
MVKYFPRANIQVAKNPVSAWNYCLKKETNVVEPYIHGIPPKPNKNNKLDT